MISDRDEQHSEQKGSIKVTDQRFHDEDDEPLDSDDNFEPEPLNKPEPVQYSQYLDDDLIGDDDSDSDKEKAPDHVTDQERQKKSQQEVMSMFRTGGIRKLQYKAPVPDFMNNQF